MQLLETRRCPRPRPARQAGTRPPPGPSVGVRGKPTVPPNRANRPRTSPGAAGRGPLCVRGHRNTMVHS